MVQLSVNVDHVATLRQARRTTYPDPVEAARAAEAAGAAGVTVHLRGDRRHIQEHDVERLRRAVRGKLNLEMAASEEMVEIALRLRPDQVTLVPERADEVTTEGGLDAAGQHELVREVAEQLAGARIAVSLFVDPEPGQIERCAELAPAPVHGVEINTDAYTRACAEPGGADGGRELARVAAAAALGASLGLRVYAGHGLTADNVGAIARLPEIEELNIGHAIVSRAVIVGLAEAVREMLDAMHATAPGG
jgi:pyridoxine 5-phosphate synthase